MGRMEEIEGFDYVIGLLQDARDMPTASTPETHIERSKRRYELMHLASEYLVLDLMGQVIFEGDFFLRTYVEES